MSIWALGRIGTDAAFKCGKVLSNALKDSYWKVRTAACTAVANMGPQLAEKTLPVLNKLLRDGSVNRQTVAETIISLGHLGEQTLI
jgi:HEAT repeat protein